ncbi:hypothetical protein FSZ31_09535 [Sphingorhabdus soli]|uniref:Pyridoxamine 5'-phosphate oxidase family protein n=1 Tax=Flavisphingopyxis soli TaxID=2601267 RepID=A0A5C6U8P9_9SPHN|nr:hypothetical protein [Sphingorhabdus soli]TXC69154.1 hypothetical protein FSZ31_09535 [Sphingorhabdus soli]
MDEQLIEFIQSGIMMVIGTCDDGGELAIARGVGARVVDAEAGLLRVVYSSSHWPRIADHLQGGGVAALTCSRPTDYMTYQFKGVAHVVIPDEDDLSANTAYHKLVATNLPVTGIDPDHVAIWLDSDCPMTVQFKIKEMYVQTPGPRAGVKV